MLESDMVPNSRPPLSWAARLSWLSLGLAFGCAGAYVLLQILDETFALQSAASGGLSQASLRLALALIWVGETLAIPSGGLSLWMLRFGEIPLETVDGIMLRSLAGMALGLCGTLVLWLLVGQIILGN